MFKLSDVAYWKPSDFNNIYNFLFIFIKSLRERTRFDLGLGYAKYGDTHYESLAISRTPSSIKRSTSLLEIYSCNFFTRYGLKNIGSASSFN